MSPPPKKTQQQVEFGDFQTPLTLAQQVCHSLSSVQRLPNSLIEPTCGRGNILFTALNQFPSLQKAYGLEISKTHLNTAKKTKNKRPDRQKIHLLHENFFSYDWNTLLAKLPDPIWILGNPPWVTNTQLSQLQSFNLPIKSNKQNLLGIEALTGKSNFDISEWMLTNILHWLHQRNALMGMLCKTTVARKILAYAWKNNISIFQSDLYSINSASHFGATVDACFLVCHFSSEMKSHTATLYPQINSQTPSKKIGFHDGKIIASLEHFQKWKHLLQTSPQKTLWRSGIKHDCAKILVLRQEGQKYRNGLGDLITLEEEFLYPLLKSSEIAKPSAVLPKQWLLVPQKTTGEETNTLQEKAPYVWDYLQKYHEFFTKRKSVIYKNRPPFSLFGIGEYSFAPWKVAIAGFYKKLHFKVLGLYQEKPILLEDTAYFIACQTQEEAEYLQRKLSSQIAVEFFQAFIFWDAKRPITSELLRKLDLKALANALQNYE